MFSSIFIIDIACLGLDIWMYTETMNEADVIAKVNTLRAENKRNQATTQLWIGAGSLIAEVAAMVAVWAAGGSII
jgi:hypothetical protein